MTARLLLFTVATFGSAQPRPPALKSPEVAPDRRVTFRLNAPKATSPLALEKDKEGKGTWTITLGPLAPDLYSYRFTVDGLTVTDRRKYLAEVAPLLWS